MGRCDLLLCRQWREEPWGYPQRPQAAILSLKFPTSVKNQTLLTRTYRLLFAIGWCFWVFYSALGAWLIERAVDRLIEPPRCYQPSVPVHLPVPT